MSMPAGISLSEGPHAWGVITFRGADALRFLQGQLSADTEKLQVGSGTLAGLHNPQGRVVALLALARTGDAEVLAALPAEMTESVIQRLRKYVLRAKVTIDDTSSVMQVAGWPAGVDPSGDARVRWGERWLSVAPTNGYPPATQAARDQWELEDVRQGLPQVFAATSEQFVAQMLNLDLVQAIAFNKGCYTGQEVIARAHYRGRVKRRMQRWLHSGAQALRPGDLAHSADGRPLSVIRVAPFEGGQEVLAVGNFVPPAEGAGEQTGERAGPALAGPLPLPYSLPE
jgi:folate-binding protein YgfZ